MSATGHCLCGAVTYQTDGDPGPVHACHCDDCQRWLGGPFLGVEFSAPVTVEGPVRWAKTSDWAERGSCGECGSALFWRLQGDHSMFTATAGSLDDKSVLGDAMAQEIFIDVKPAYYAFTGDRKRLTAAEVYEMFAPKDPE